MVKVAPVTLERSGGTNDEWVTPPELWRPVNDHFVFDLDVAASAENAICPRHYSKERSGLAADAPWDAHAAWNNPPYSLAGEFVRRMADETNAGRVRWGVSLVLARTETEWWHRHAWRAWAWIFLKGRVPFIDPTGAGRTSPTSPSVLLIHRRWGSGKPPRAERWAWKGGEPFEDVMRRLHNVW